MTPHSYYLTPLKKTGKTRQKTSISELVEQYFHSISKPAKHQNIIDMVEKLKPAKFNVNADLKKDFYEEQASKYGF